MKVIVLGAGLVGGPMAIDLARDEGFEVAVADTDEEALQKLIGANPRIAATRVDLSETDVVKALAADHDPPRTPSTWMPSRRRRGSPL